MSVTSTDTEYLSQLSDLLSEKASDGYSLCILYSSSSDDETEKISISNSSNTRTESSGEAYSPQIVSEGHRTRRKFVSSKASSARIVGQDKQTTYDFKKTENKLCQISVYNIKPARNNIASSQHIICSCQSLLEIHESYSQNKKRKSTADVCCDAEQNKLAKMLHAKEYVGDNPRCEGGSFLALNSRYLPKFLEAPPPDEAAKEETYKDATALSLQPIFAHDTHSINEGHTCNCEHHEKKAITSYLKKYSSKRLKCFGKLRSTKQVAPVTSNVQFSVSKQTSYVAVEEEHINYTRKADQQRYSLPNHSSIKTQTLCNNKAVSFVIEPNFTDVDKRNNSSTVSTVDTSRRNSQSIVQSMEVDIACDFRHKQKEFYENPDSKKCIKEKWKKWKWKGPEKSDKLDGKIRKESNSKLVIANSTGKKEKTKMGKLYNIIKENIGHDWVPQKQGPCKLKKKSDHNLRKQKCICLKNTKASTCMRECELQTEPEIKHPTFSLHLHMPNKKKQSKYNDDVRNVLKISKYYEPHNVQLKNKKLAKLISHKSAPIPFLTIEDAPKYYGLKTKRHASLSDIDNYDSHIKLHVVNKDNLKKYCKKQSRSISREYSRAGVKSRSKHVPISSEAHISRKQRHKYISLSSMHSTSHRHMRQPVKHLSLSIDKESHNPGTKFKRQLLSQHDLKSYYKGTHPILNAKNKAEYYSSHSELENEPLQNQKGTAHFGSQPKCESYSSMDNKYNSKESLHIHNPVISSTNCNKYDNYCAHPYLSPTASTADDRSYNYRPRSSRLSTTKKYSNDYSKSSVFGDSFTSRSHTSSLLMPDNRYDKDGSQRNKLSSTITDNEYDKDIQQASQSHSLSIESNDDKNTPPSSQLRSSISDMQHVDNQSQHISWPPSTSATKLDNFRTQRGPSSAIINKNDDSYIRSSSTSDTYDNDQPEKSPVPSSATNDSYNSYKPIKTACSISITTNANENSQMQKSQSHSSIINKRYVKYQSQTSLSGSLDTNTTLDYTHYNLQPTTSTLPVLNVDNDEVWFNKDNRNIRSEQEATPLPSRNIDKKKFKSQPNVLHLLKHGSDTSHHSEIQPKSLKMIVKNDSKNFNSQAHTMFLSKTNVGSDHSQVQKASMSLSIIHTNVNNLPEYEHKMGIVSLTQVNNTTDCDGKKCGSSNSSIIDTNEQPKSKLAPLLGIGCESRINKIQEHLRSNLLNLFKNKKPKIPIKKCASTVCLLL